MARRCSLFCMTCLFALLFTLPAVAETIELPSEAAALFLDTRWEGYRIMDVSGYAGNKDFAAQYALLLKKDDHNVLCIVEKAPTQSDYTITLESDIAVYQGDLLPVLLIDTGGDSLFYTYRHEHGDIRSEHYHAVKTEGEWASVDIILHHTPRENLYPETLIWAANGQLLSQRILSDENGNMLENGETILIHEDTGNFQRLLSFDIDAAMDIYLQQVK